MEKKERKIKQKEWDGKEKMDSEGSKARSQLKLRASLPWPLEL